VELATDMIREMERLSKRIPFSVPLAVGISSGFVLFKYIYVAHIITIITIYI